MLDRVERGERFACLEYTVVLTQALNAVQIPARRVSLFCAGYYAGVGGAHAVTVNNACDAPNVQVGRASELRSRAADGARCWRRKQTPSQRRSTAHRNAQRGRPTHAWIRAGLQIVEHPVMPRPLCEPGRYSTPSVMTWHFSGSQRVRAKGMPRSLVSADRVSCGVAGRASSLGTLRYIQSVAA